MKRKAFHFISLFFYKQKNCHEESIVYQGTSAILRSGLGEELGITGSAGVSATDFTGDATGIETA